MDVPRRHGRPAPFQGSSKRCAFAFAFRCAEQRELGVIAGMHPIAIATARTT
jgi:hypothetical protein